MSTVLLPLLQGNSGLGTGQGISVVTLRNAALCGWW